ncbi:MAG: hypothetical protein ACYC2G_13065 [Gemmatimonadaceae bacterium]
MSTFRLIRRTEVGGLASGEVARDDELERCHRLPSFARNHSYHRGEHRLQRALRPLQGKFSVVNPVTVIALPPLARSRLRGLLGVQPTHSGQSAVGAARTVALHEPVDPLVLHERRAAASDAMPGRDILFRGELRYRLVLGGAAAADPLTAAQATTLADGPIPWFRTALLVPDADAIRQMDPSTAHFYRLVTGRLGSGSTDRYWYLDAWERFHEDGRVIGFVSPALVEHGHTVGAISGSQAVEPHAPTEEEILFGDIDPLVASRFPPYSPAFDRRGFVPPGYCLIHYIATVELAATGAAARTAA